MSEAYKTWQYNKEFTEEANVVFSKSIRLANSNLAKILAVREAFVIFKASRWRNKHKLVTKSDLANVVKWIRQQNTTP